MLNIPGSSLGYKHTEENLLKMSELKKGELNPMFNKIKSEAFIAQQIRDKSTRFSPARASTGPCRGQGGFTRGPRVNLVKTIQCLVRLSLNRL